MWTDRQKNKHDEQNKHVKFGMETNHERIHRML